MDKEIPVTAEKSEELHRLLQSLDPQHIYIKN